MDEVAAIPPHTVVLEDGQTVATVYSVNNPEDLPHDLLEFLCEEYNMEIDRGETLAFYDPMTVDEFISHWFNGLFTGFMVIGDEPELVEGRQWEREWLGGFYVAPKYPKRSGHICTGDILVNAGIRAQGIGKILLEQLLKWAPQLGYTFVMFDLVYASNLPAIGLLETYQFKRLGKVKNAGIVKNQNAPVDSIMFGREISTTDAHPLEIKQGTTRFQRIQYYLQTGKYPSDCDQKEKSRLRTFATQYSLVAGVLMFKGKEVVEDRDRQVDLATRIHISNEHTGINRTTSAVSELYHWLNIKKTVTSILKSCEVCSRSRPRFNGETALEEELQDVN